MQEAFFPLVLSFFYLRIIHSPPKQFSLARRAKPENTARAEPGERFNSCDETCLGRFFSNIHQPSQRKARLISIHNDVIWLRKRANHKEDYVSLPLILSLLCDTRKAERKKKVSCLRSASPPARWIFEREGEKRKFIALQCYRYDKSPVHMEIRRGGGWGGWRSALCFASQQGCYRVTRYGQLYAVYIEIMMQFVEDNFTL